MGVYQPRSSGFQRNASTASRFACVSSGRGRRRPAADGSSNVVRSIAQGVRRACSRRAGSRRSRAVVIAECANTQTEVLRCCGRRVVLPPACLDVHDCRRRDDLARPHSLQAIKPIHHPRKRPFGGKGNKRSPPSITPPHCRTGRRLMTPFPVNLAAAAAPVVPTMWLPTSHARGIDLWRRPSSSRRPQGPRSWAPRSVANERLAQGVHGSAPGLRAAAAQRPTTFQQFWPPLRA